VSVVNRSFRARLVCCLLTTGLPVAASALPAGPEITINIYNDARVSEGILSQAEHEAARIFQNARLDIAWIACQPSKTRPITAAACRSPLGLTHLVLRIVPWSSHLGDSIFGSAFLSKDGDGVYCDVFYPSVETLHRDSDASPSRVLGHVMAHEIGHLILGTNAHSALGIMRPHWQGEELRRIGMGTLLFTPQQMRHMQARLVSISATLAVSDERMNDERMNDEQ
jgi:hypothetical protein